MTKISASDISTIRTQPHRTVLWLSIYQPSVIFSSQINDGSLSNTKGARVIPYDNVTEGSPGLVQNGMTAYIGSTPGNDDVGAIRIRSATGGGSTGTFTVAENSDISWSDDEYLTVVDFFEINAVYPRIIQNPADETKTLWYKDYDIAYSDQNTKNGAFICMGTHFAGFLEDGECNIYYSASGTFHVNGESMSYVWSFEGATVTGSSVHTPGYVTYDTPGHYTTRLQVNGASGSVDYSYRHVSIYDRPDEGSNPPILNWELRKLDGNRDSAEVDAEIVIHNSAPETQIRDGSLVVIWAEDWYGDTKESIGGYQNGRSSIVYNGYIENGSIRYNWRDKSVSFSVRSPTGIMKMAEGFSVSLEDIDDPVTRSTNEPGVYPSPWVLVPALSVRKALWHYLKWHSTVLLCTDFEFTATDQLIQYFDADRSSLFNAIDGAMTNILIGSICSDMQGKIWAEQDTYLDDALYQSPFLMDDQDWIGEPSIEIAMSNPTSFIEMGGIAYTGFGGTSTPYLSGAPGETPGYRGTIEKMQGLALTNQDHLNQLNGRLYGYLNRDYTLLTYRMAGNYRMFDIAPQDRYTLNISAEQNPRGVALSLDSFVQSVEWVYNPERESFHPDVRFTHLGDWIDGESMVIPPVPPSSSTDGSYNIPPIVIPPINIPPISIQNAAYLFVPALGGIDGSNNPLIYAGPPLYANPAGYLADAGVPLLTGGGAQGIFAVPLGVSSFSFGALIHANCNGGSMEIETAAVSISGETEGVDETPPVITADGYQYASLITGVVTTAGEVVGCKCSVVSVSGSPEIRLLGWLIIFGASVI